MAIRLSASWDDDGKFKRFTSEWRANAIRGVNRAAARLERQIKINAVKGGAFRRAKGRPWVPNPGKHLRRGDGTLVNSWRMRLAQIVGNNVEGHVSSWVPYSAIHEFGGRAGRGLTAIIPERPYVRPAMKEVGLKMAEDVKSAIMDGAK